MDAGDWIALLSLVIAFPAAALSVFNFFEARRVPRPGLQVSFRVHYANKRNDPDFLAVEMMAVLNLSTAKSGTVIETVSLENPPGQINYLSPATADQGDVIHPRSSWSIHHSRDASTIFYLRLKRQYLVHPVIVRFTFRAHGPEGYAGDIRIRRRIDPALEMKWQ